MSVSGRVFQKTSSDKKNMSILEGPMSLRSYSENTRDSQSNWDLTKTMDQPTRPHFFWPHCHMCFIWGKKQTHISLDECSSSKYIFFFSPSRCPSSVPRFPQPKNVVSTTSTTAQKRPPNLFERFWYPAHLGVLTQATSCWWGHGCKVPGRLSFQTVPSPSVVGWGVKHPPKFGVRLFRTWRVSFFFIFVCVFFLLGFGEFPISPKLNRIVKNTRPKSFF